MKNNSLVIGADIGGTHITAALVDIDQRTIVMDSLVREEVNSHASAVDIIEVWSKAITGAARDTSADKLSLAIPGPFDYEKGISLMKGQQKYEHLHHHNVKELLAAKLNFKPENISLMNDAASFLQGEAFIGAALGYRKAIGVTLGTGLGTCIYQNNVAEDAGLWNMPFKESIAEAYLSTRWFVKRYFELSGEKITGVKELLLKAGNYKIVQQIFDEFGENLARFLEQFIAIYQPEVVVLGGNIAKSFQYFEAILSLIIKQKYPEVLIKTAELGEEAALFGAVSYWHARNRVDICNQNFF